MNKYYSDKSLVVSHKSLLDDTINLAMGFTPIAGTGKAISLAMGFTPIAGTGKAISLAMGFTPIAGTGKAISLAMGFTPIAGTGKAISLAMGVKPIESAERNTLAAMGIKPIALGAHTFSKVFLITVLLCCSFFSQAQDSYLPLNSPVYNVLDRLEIKTGVLKNDIFLDLKPISQLNIVSFLHQVDSLQPKLTKSDEYWIDYLKNETLPFSGISNESSKKPILKYFYKSKANLYQVTSDHFNIFINPVLNFEGGKEKDSAGYLYRNTRGLEVHGNIDNKVGFYTFLTDNQAIFPGYVGQFYERTKSIPGEGYIKTFKGNGYDFFHAQGYITLAASKHIHLQFGNDRNFIGNGYRSLLLSDFSKDYLHLKINTRVWRFNYQNIFAQMIDLHTKGFKPYPKKYAAFHVLSFDVTKFLNVGVFEGVMFYDTLHNGRGYDLSYLNPVIFYRSIEQSIGSADNSIAGINFSLVALKHVRIYGQWLFDEFSISNLRNGKKSWLNKYGGQLGFKWVDLFGLPNIDLQSEINFVRPYTYQHLSTGSNYVNYSQAIAHPLGANLRELVNILRVNVYGPIDINIKYTYSQQGKDTGNANLGGDISKNYAQNIPLKEGVSLLQGSLSTIQFFDFVATWQVRQNICIDLEAFSRKQTIGSNAANEIYIGGGVRVNFFKPDYNF